MPIPQSNPGDAPGPDWCAGRKVTETHKALLWKLLSDDPTCPSRLHAIAETPEQITVTLRHINRLRKAWGLNRGKGRPHRVDGQKKGEPQGHLVRVTASLSFVGVHVCEAWWQQHGGMSAVMPLLQQAIPTYRAPHPDDDFPLLHHREQTLRRRFQALFFAPLLGIETLTAFDTHAHPLQTLLGRRYHSATLTPCLGPLERIDAAGALLPALVPQQVGHIAYVDGHMIA